MSRQPMPRWKRFIVQGLVLLVAAGVASGVGDTGLGVVLLVIAGALIFAGLIGGAVNSGDRTDDVGPRT